MGLSAEVRKLLQQGREDAAAELAPHLIAGHLPRLSGCVDDQRPEEREAFRRLAAATEKRSDDDN